MRPVRRDGPMILFLADVKVIDGEVVGVHLGTRFASPGSLVDAHEREIMRVIRTGAHLYPVYSARLLRYRLVVRAWLEGRTDTRLVWRIRAVLLGKASKPTILVPLQPWHARAEAILQHPAGKGAKSKPSRDEVRRELARLLQLDRDPNNLSVE